MNKKTKGVCVALLAVSSMGICAFSQALPPNAGMPQVRKVDTATRSNFLAKTGGFIKSPAKGSSVRIINAQSRVKSDTINEIVNNMKLTFRCSIVVVNSKASKDGVSLVDETLKWADTAAALVIIDAPGQPVLLVAPETRWAIMNVAALCTKEMNSETLQERTKKQLWRTYGYLMGCANSTTDQCVMRPIFKPEDLDTLKFSTLGLEPIAKIQQQAKAYGITPERMYTYRKACEEGWAPTPTNAVQKAIWEEVKTKKATEPKTEAVK